MNDQPFIFTPEQEAWLVDLETTEEPQTRGDLHRFSDYPGGGGYCCLGRACVVLGVEEKRMGALGAFKGSTSMLPDGVAEQLGLRSDCGELLESVRVDASGELLDTLTALNDTACWSFKEIAAYIRANPRNVFTEAAND